MHSFSLLCLIMLLALWWLKMNSALYIYKLYLCGCFLGYSLEFGYLNNFSYFLILLIAIPLCLIFYESVHYPNFNSILPYFVSFLYFITFNLNIFAIFQFYFYALYCKFIYNLTHYLIPTMLALIIFFLYGVSVPYVHLI